jgi:hypothetical protein
MILRRALGVFALLCACDGQSPVELGRFRVVATRQSATCGPQSNAYLSRAEFDVILQLTGEGGFSWGPVGSSATRGLWSGPSRSFRVLLEEDIVAWAPDRRREIVGCMLRRSDVIEGTVELESDGGANVDASTPDGGAPLARSFRATETIVYGVGAGDCRAIIGAAKGQYSQLPCEVTYNFDARRM